MKRLTVLADTASTSAASWRLTYRLDMTALPCSLPTSVSQWTLRGSNPKPPRCRQGAPPVVPVNVDAEMTTSLHPQGAARTAARDVRPAEPRNIELSPPTMGSALRGIASQWPQRVPNLRHLAVSAGQRAKRSDLRHLRRRPRRRLTCGFSSPRSPFPRVFPGVTAAGGCAVPAVPGHGLDLCALWARRPAGPPAAAWPCSTAAPPSSDPAPGASPRRSCATAWSEATRVPDHPRRVLPRGRPPDGWQALPASLTLGRSES
jgi:hypothetical protein